MVPADGTDRLARPRLVRERDRYNLSCQVWVVAALVVSDSVDYYRHQYPALQALVVVGDHSDCHPHHQVVELAAPGSLSCRRLTDRLALSVVSHCQMASQADLRGPRLVHSWDQKPHQSCIPLRAYVAREPDSSRLSRHLLAPDFHIVFPRVAAVAGVSVWACMSCHRVLDTAGADGH